MIRKLVDFQLGLGLLKVFCLGAVLVTYSYQAAASDSNAATVSNETSKLPITIYYETLCSDSMVFITHQLYPSWLRREKEMKLRLVPFGKSWIDERNNDSPVYHCQHGPRECELNILHGCILEKLPFNKAFPVVACLMKNFRTSFEKCIESHADKKEAINSCSKGQLGGILYKDFANQTDSVHRPLPFVPTIVDDEPYNYYEQDNWLQHFDRKFVERYEAKYGTKL
ncbi:GILT-like protein 2 [Anopheles aquasalis]|uniref:GILT-like protein 2 n=1 Tax=Anopheles aquasalis TaxID=42839 RepID=UPI00215B67C7|nr:GILT-like protein 2 [Anopheles aquasalis]